ncbi:MAG: response regulator [Myxococcales bacterium]
MDRARLRDEDEPIKGPCGPRVDAADFDRFAHFALECIADATYLVAESGHIVFANPAASRMLGYSVEELCSLRMFDLNVDLDLGNWAAIWTLLRTAGRRTFEARHRRKDGSVVPVEVSATLLMLSGAQYSCAFIRDIRERKNLEGRLAQAEKLEAIGRLAGGVAHDFNNQLAGILGYAELAQLAAAENPAVLGKLEQLTSVVKVASDLTAQLLAFSRRGKFLSEPVDLHRLVREVVSLATRSFAKNIQVETELGAAQPRTVGDPSQLQSAVLNLLLNARDAMPEGGTISLHTFNRNFLPSNEVPPPYGLEPGDYVCLQVRDTGVGMEPEVCARIFEPFFTTKEIGAGTGLGLAAVYGTLKNHHGAVGVESYVGKGSIFTIYLPVSNRRVSFFPENNEPQSLRLRGRVMVVDDEESVREVARGMLEALGCHVTTFADGESAIAYFRTHPYQVDLVLLDLIMPGLSGAETFERLTEIDSEVQVVVASGYSIDGQAQALIDRGAKSFLQKPFSMSALAQRVGPILGPAEIRR